MANLYTGTSGYSYPSWKPDFYLPKHPAKKFLEYYATRLNSVEINYTFRRHPAATTLENWVQQTGEDFVFSIKAHQRITHIQSLLGQDKTVFLFFKHEDSPAGALYAEEMLGTAHSQESAV